MQGAHRKDIANSKRNEEEGHQKVAPEMADNTHGRRVVMVVEGQTEWPTGSPGVNPMEPLRFTPAQNLSHGLRCGNLGG